MMDASNVNKVLKDKVALVTGGGTGIGRAIAFIFAEYGADVAVNYSRSSTEAEETAKLIWRCGSKAITLQADVSREDEVEDMVARAVQEFGRLDILVNNAGTTKFIEHSNLDGLTKEVWDRILAVNVEGTFFCIRAATRVMRAGRIINIGSTSGFDGSGSCIAYAASKSAIHTMTKSLALVLAPHITVNTIAPGLTETRWLVGHEAKVQKIVQSLPVKRIGRPEDIAHAALFLATADNYLTGQIIVVDGGELL